MPDAKFTLEESLDTTKQMAVRRTYTKATGGKPKSLFPVSVDAVTNTLSLLPLTQPASIALESPLKMTLARDGDSIVQKPKQRQIRKTSSGIQKFRVNKFNASDHAKKAYKRATSWYAKELNKTNGLSSYQIF